MCVYTLYMCLCVFAYVRIYVHVHTYVYMYILYYTCIYVCMQRPRIRVMERKRVKRDPWQPLDPHSKNPAQERPFRKGTCTCIRCIIRTVHVGMHTCTVYLYIRM